MKYRGLLVTVMLILASAAFASAPYNVSPDQFQPVKTGYKYITDSGMRLGLEITEPYWSVVGTEAAPVEVAEFMSGGLLEVEGYPSVPISGSMFRIPPRSGVIIEVTDVEYDIYTDMDYAVFFGTGEPGDMRISANPVDEWYPGKLAEVGKPALFHDFRVTNLVTFPIQVNTARREVRVYSNIQVDIRFEGTDETNALPHWPTHISEAFLPFYRTFLDWDESELDEYTLYRGNVQVVMRDNDMLMELMEPWFEWKLQRGWNLELLTDDDVNWVNSAIKTELQSRWNTAETKFDYVVIVGDDAGSFAVPPGTGSGYGAGDQGYSTIVGDDNLADVGVGRISVQDNGQVSAYVNKVLAYERDPDLDNTDWYLRGVVTRSDNFAGISKIFTMRYWRHGLLDLGYTQVDTSWGGGGANTVAINCINNGVTVYATRGYLGTGLNSAQINNLNNDFMTPVVFDVTCGTGSWASGTGTNEYYMRAGSVNTPKGAIGAFGTATSGTDPDFNNCLGGGSGWALFHLRMPCMGDMTLGAKVNVWNNFNGFNNQELNDFCQWYNLMGDPLVYVWTCIPQIIDVTADDQIELGKNTYDVLVQAEDEPLENAWVTLYRNDESEELFTKGVTDAEGRLTLETPFRYSGEAILTVSKRDYAPNRMTVNIAAPNARVGLESISFLDNGNYGTVGNGNGVPETGEKVGLIITAKNYGGSVENNVRAELSSEEPWIIGINGNTEFGSLSTLESTTGIGLIYVEIAPQAQHDWLLHFDVDFITDSNTYTDGFTIKVNAPRFALVQVNGAEELDPGDNTNINIELMNVGGSDAAPSTARLLRVDPYLSIPAPTGTFGAMVKGADATSTQFQIGAHESTIPGHRASAMLVVTTETGQVDTTMIYLDVGSKESTDPSGPDRYGYLGFDITDEDYDHVPTYDWVEINPDAGGNDYDGEELNVNDPAENADDGGSQVVDLPFEIQYYGVVFDQLTAFTNGMIGMGSQDDMNLNRNWTIPTPLGPNYMIAPYWDELRTSVNTGIFTYYDEPNGRFIVEWYDMKHHNPAYSCTFEVIFYDTAIRPTITGDNEFLFQYHDVDHSSGGMQYDVPYWTSGIENGTQSDGILLAYWNVYASGAATIIDESAVLFTTNYIPPSGLIEGVVTDAETEEPLEEVLVQTTDGLYSAITDQDGFYRLENVMTGEYAVSFSDECYNDGEVVDVLVVDNGTSTVNYEMNHPEFSLSPLTVLQELDPDEEVTVALTVANYGNGPLQYSAMIRFENPEAGGLTGGGGVGPIVQGELDEPWDDLYRFGLETFESRHRGLVFIGDYFYISGSDNYDPDGPNKIYKYTREGEYAATFDQPVPEEERSSAGFYGMTWDGEFLYGCDNGRLYQMTVSYNEIALVGSVECPANPARYLAYDPEHDQFWMGDYGTTIFAVDRDGTTLAEYGQEFCPRGASWYDIDPDGYKLYMVCRSTGDFYTRIIKMDAETGQIIPVWDYVDLENNMLPAGADITYLWNSQYWALASIMDVGAADSVRIWEMSTYTTWAQLTNTSGTVNPDDSTDVELNLRSTGLNPGDYQLWVCFDHDACSEVTGQVQVTMTVAGLRAEDNEPVPLNWELGKAYPNPFNPTTAIRYSLREPALVKAKVYNLLGRQVAVLAERKMAAGKHELLFDANHLASGMYFLRFEAGPINEVRKLVLLR